MNPQVTTNNRCVVVLAKGFPPTAGGVETYSYEVARAYLRTRRRVVVMTQTEGPVGWAEVETPDGTLLLWNAGAGSQSVVFARMLISFLVFSRRHDIELVHATTWRVGLVARIALFRRAPLVLTVHGREVLNYPAGMGMVMRSVFNAATLVIAVSGATLHAALASVRPKAKESWIISFNGLSEFTGEYSDVCLPASSGTDTVNILSLCRLVPRKNIDRAVRAAISLLRSGQTDFIMKIAGRGPELESISRLIESEGASDNIKLLGYVSNDQVPALYEWADIFVHPHSHVGDGEDFEGFGITIADAMAARCAVIVGHEGGPADYIAPWENGVLVDGNKTSDIVDALGLLIGDPAKRREIGLAARDYAIRHFTWDGHVGPAIELFSAEARLVRGA